jgi:flagellar motor protein MotB
LFLVSTGLPRGVAAQDGNGEASSATSTDDSNDASETDASGEASSDEEDEEADGDDGDDTSEEPEESEHGSYEWKPSYGGGIGYGLFYSGLDRWNLHLLEPNGVPSLDAKTVSSLTLSAEASLIEGSRLTVFAGFEKPFHSNPSLLAVYGGLEPAFAFRRGDWEMALGIGVGIGSVKLSTENRGSFNAGLVVLRPVLEIRRYVDELFAAYVRLGFNQWLPYNASGDELSIRAPEQSRPGLPEENLLYEGGFFTSLGVRFGHYPEPVERIPDSDGDGRRDDVDDCVDTPEDDDGYEDYDGCPDEDNDGDDIPDADDACPDDSEDLDGFEDDDGCPDEAADIDRDGIVDSDDECPKYAEDEDGYEDDDGCPDEDNDDDGIEDADDECPDEPGIESESGCPSEIVTLEEDAVVVDPAIRFQVPEDGPDQRPGSTLTEDSRKALEELAAVLKVHDELERIEIQGHTGEGDDEEEMKTLSTKRAEAVRSVLVSAGVSADRLVAKGYGFSKPVMPDGDGENTDPTPKARIAFVVETRADNDETSDASPDSDAEGDASSDDDS